MNLPKIISFGVVLMILLSGCATYYQKNKTFHRYFENGDFEKASNELDNTKFFKHDKNKLLYLLEKGMTLQLAGEFEKSNVKFEEAYRYAEEFQKQYSAEVISLLTNPSVKPYPGEDHEIILINYFKALNYLHLNDLDAAMVECRRLNDKLYTLNSRYENKKNRYQQDAFALNLMGMLYEASGDFNNAFIAYRNAYTAYNQDYEQYFDTKCPKQLKEDLLRMAYLIGFYEELEYYERDLGSFEQEKIHKGPELILFWHNGLGPVKEEWSINFVIIQKQGGVVTFVNSELGLSFAFVIPSSEVQAQLSDIKIIRVAFPKYHQRKPVYTKAIVTCDEQEYQLEMAENINDIAVKTLEDRMIRELATALLRLAIKQAISYKVQQESGGLGLLITTLNAISEKADTRNWQTLPNDISYTRIPLQKGHNEIDVSLVSPYNTRNKNETIKIDAEDEEIIFYVFNSLQVVN